MPVARLSDVLGRVDHVVGAGEVLEDRRIELLQPEDHRVVVGRLDAVDAFEEGLPGRDDTLRRVAHAIEGRLDVLRRQRRAVVERDPLPDLERSEEHTSELQSLMRISYAVFCLKKKKHQKNYK